MDDSRWIEDRLNRIYGFWCGVRESTNIIYLKQL